MDASNLLKPALARGELHCVGATTLDEYRKARRKGRRPGPSLPAGLRRRTDGGGHGLHPARPEGEVRGPPRGPHFRQRHRRRRHPVEPLHHRPLPAGQGHRPDRRGRQPRAHGRGFQARGPGRDRPPAGPAEDRARGPEEGNRHGLPAPSGKAGGRDRRSGRPVRRPDPPVEGGKGQGRPRRPAARNPGPSAPGTGQRPARGRPGPCVRDRLRPDPADRKAARRSRGERDQRKGPLDARGRRRRTDRRRRQPLDRRARRQDAGGRTRETAPDGDRARAVASSVRTRRWPPSPTPCAAPAPA